jgi:tetratricopeptide (TPR) repeat protein
MTALHPAPVALERFILGQLSPAEMREVARHLLAGCPECQEVTAGLWEPADIFANRCEDPQALATAELVGEDSLDAHDGYDEVLDRVFEQVVATEARLADQRALGRKLYDELMQCPAERRRLLLSNSQRFRNRMFCELLVEESYEAGFADPRRAVEVAELAVLALDRLRVEDFEGEEAQAGLRVRAWAQLGNAFRINSDLASSERAFSMTESLLSESRVPLIERARVLALLASWRRAQRRFGEALQIFDRVAAIYKKLGQWNLLGRTLLQKALVCSWAGDAEGEMKLLRRALDLIDPQADPRVFLAARHNLIHALYDQGRVREAFALLYHTRPLYLKAGDRMNLLKLRWLEGLVAFGLQRIDQAEAAFREVREAFLELGLGYDAALASLDLVGVYVLQGRTADVSRVAEETLAIFQAHNTHREALAALLVFCSAARLDEAGIDLVREVSSFLKQVRNNPELRFPKPS